MAASTAADGLVIGSGYEGGEGCGAPLVVEGPLTLVKYPGSADKGIKALRERVAQVDRVLLTLDGSGSNEITEPRGRFSISIGEVIKMAANTNDRLVTGQNDGLMDFYGDGGLFLGKRKYTDYDLAGSNVCVQNYGDKGVSTQMLTRVRVSSGRLAEVRAYDDAGGNFVLPDHVTFLDMGSNPQTGEGSSQTDSLPETLYLVA